jgi:predicted nucleotidyltransferase
MGTELNHNRPFVLFGKARQTVLSLFFMNPEDVYYLRQISRITGIGMGALQRELKLLTEGGIINRVVRGRQVLYQVSRTCSIFDELKSIVIKTVGVRDILKAALTPFVDIINVALIYGSFATGKEKRASDIDVLIVGDISFERVVSVFDDAQKITGREINPVVYPVGEFRGKLINDHHFLAAVVEKPVIFLIGDKSELERLAR